MSKWKSKDNCPFVSMNMIFPLISKSLKDESGPKYVRARSAIDKANVLKVKTKKKS